MAAKPLHAMRMDRPNLVGLAVLALTFAVPGTAATLVVCAPGYPGSTKEAQPAMDAFASAAGDAAGWPKGELAAVYFETEAAGVERLSKDDAALALVPLPFYLRHRETLRLAPRAQAVMAGGQASEPWSLVAGKGKVTSPAALDGFELVSLAGYVPRFVRGPALGAWGELPPGLTITFTGTVLSGLRRAAAGEKVVLLLDGPQAAAMKSLPFAANLEVVVRSAPLPVSVLCLVGTRLPAARSARLLKALPHLGDSEAGAAALAGLRLAGFVAADEKALAAAQAAFGKARE
ncbi:MAG: hypothetical protein MUF10_15030 [Thermoanaerobaculaceae bacterium]|nr:hypothetical protein [Thermoanaerobaculaceae bacterium]